MAKISFIYFDVGGVAIQDFSDSPKWDIMMADMGLDKFDRKIVDEIYDSHEDEIAIGHRHVDSLIEIYKKEFNISLDPAFSMQKYFVNHFKKNIDLWPIIFGLKKSTQIGLLTDMYPGMLDEIIANDLLPIIEWDQIVDSSVEGMRKPMPEIYKLATARAGVPANEILFIDNRQKNIVGAQGAGWQTFFYDSSNYAQANLDLSIHLEPLGL